MSSFEIDVQACRDRQARVVAAMKTKNIDLAIFSKNEHVQYLAGPRYKFTFSPLVALTADGKLTLVAPNKPPETAAADEVTTYEAQWHSTMRNDQCQASCAALLETFGGKTFDRIGVEFSCFPPHLSTAMNADLVDLEPTMYQLRQIKDADELASIRKAIAGTGKMYEKARELIEPGVSEITIFNELQTAATEEFGEMMTGTGNDYQVNARGGPPRNGVTAKPGDLYILDLGPAFRGYFADNSRAIAVTDVSDAQQQAWEAIMKVFAHLESTVKPGKSCKELFNEAQAILDECPVGVFNHHLGHGIGLFPHEAPHLNPNWDDVFQVGEVFTAEPGLYAPELQAGMRIENDYLVTETGVELLSDFPLELKLS